MELSKRLLAPISEEQDNALKEFCKNIKGMTKAELARKFIDLVSDMDSESAGVIVFDKNNIRLYAPGEEIQNFNEQYDECKFNIEYNKIKGVNIDFMSVKQLIKK